MVESNGVWHDYSLAVLLLKEYCNVLGAERNTRRPGCGKKWATNALDHICIVINYLRNCNLTSVQTFFR